MNDLTYTEFHNNYVYSKALRKVYQNRSHLEGTEFWKVILPNSRKVFISKRLQPDKCIVRMNMLYPSAGEVFYLRLLLINKACRSYAELRNSGTNNVHNVDEEEEMDENAETNPNRTFQEACLRNGLLHDHNEAIRCFQEAMIFSAPKELRNLFVIQSIQGFPTLNIFNDPIKRRAMSLDYIIRDHQGDNSPMALNNLLLDLSTRFQLEGRYYSNLKQIVLLSFL